MTTNDLFGSADRTSPMGAWFAASERDVRLCIARCLVVMALIGVVSSFSDGGPQTFLALWVAGSVFVSTLPVAVFFWLRSDVSIQGWSRDSGVWGPMFVVYVDLGITTVLATFVDHEAALSGCALFAVMSIYVALFSRTVIALAHSAIAITVIVTFTVLTAFQQGQDVAGTVARSLVILLIGGAAFTLPHRFAIGLRQSLQAQTDQALTDPLTGLLNRRGFQRSAAAILRAPDAGVFLVDVDRFKNINDSFGHDAGDHALRLLAHRLRMVVGDTGAIGRLGGDEFAVAAPVAPHELRSLAAAVLGTLTDRRDTVPITVSIGVTDRAAPLWSESTTDELDESVRRTLARADTAMYSAKAQGRNRISHLYANHRYGVSSTDRPNDGPRHARDDDEHERVHVRAVGWAQSNWSGTRLLTQSGGSGRPHSHRYTESG